MLVYVLSANIITVIKSSDEQTCILKSASSYTLDFFLSSSLSLSLSAAIDNLYTFTCKNFVVRFAFNSFRGDSFVISFHPNRFVEHLLRRRHP